MKEGSVLHDIGGAKVAMTKCYAHTCSSVRSAKAWCAHLRYDPNDDQNKILENHSQCELLRDKNRSRKKYIQNIYTKCLDFV